MRRVTVVAAAVALGLAGCQGRSSPVPSEQPVRPSGVEHGPAEKGASIAAGLAEDFMKTQSDADQYSKRATVVHPEGTGVYVVRFQLLDNSSKNHALVRAIPAERRCERIRVK